MEFAQTAVSTPCVKAGFPPLVLSGVEAVNFLCGSVPFWEGARRLGGDHNLKIIASRAT
jgi:hypothetical protein